MLHSYELHEYEPLATRINEHGLGLMLVLLYVWIGPKWCKLRRGSLD